MKKIKSQRLARLRAVTAISVLIILSVFCFSACTNGSDKDSKHKITVPASEVIETMTPKIENFKAEAELSYSDSAYAANFPTLYKGLDISDITDGAIIYDETGNTADEISILVAPDKEHTEAVEAALKQRASKRASDFGGYKPEESDKAQMAKIITCDRYVMLAVGSDSSAMQKQFQIAMQAYAQNESDSDK